MAMQSVSMFVIIELAVALSWQYSSVTGLNVHLLEYNCTAFSHHANSDAEKACDEVFKYICEHTAGPGYSIQKHLNIGYDTYYGHGACSGNINQDECTRCLEAAHDWVHVRLVDAGSVWRTTLSARAG